MRKISHFNLFFHSKCILRREIFAHLKTIAKGNLTLQLWFSLGLYAEMNRKKNATKTLSQQKKSDLWAALFFIFAALLIVWICQSSVEKNKTIPNAFERGWLADCFIFIFRNYKFQLLEAFSSEWKYNWSQARFPLQWCIATPTWPFQFLAFVKIVLE